MRVTLSVFGDSDRPHSFLSFISGDCFLPLDLGLALPFVVEDAWEPAESAEADEARSAASPTFSAGERCGNKQVLPYLHPPPDS